ncbi:MAG: histidine phosphatase family protein [Rhizobiales bacterium]|nr:histidine phosphatase family protein [Hyphomicrobiales bacterium]
MLKLFLLRHAKSSWTDPGLDDLDRPLNARGLRAAAAIGRFMRQSKLSPELVLCSPARRARETWKFVAEELRTAPRVIIDEGIYDFGNGGRLLEVARNMANGATPLMIVGHNPSMERLAVRLIRKGDPKLVKRLEQKYPTGALSVIEFPGTKWSDVAEGAGELVSFTRPADLEVEAK